jgi:ribosomal protein L37AE/L43A
MADQASRIKSKNQPRHCCRVCGITELSQPNEDFRYCSKCEGTQCYCSAHLRDHEHVTKDVAASQR